MVQTEPLGLKKV